MGCQGRKAALIARGYSGRFSFRSVSVWYDASRRAWNTGAAVSSLAATADRKTCGKIDTSICDGWDGFGWSRPVYFVTVLPHGSAAAHSLPNTIVADDDSRQRMACRPKSTPWMVAVVGCYHPLCRVHVHFFCAAEHDAKTLSVLLIAWKEWTSKQVARESTPRL